MPPTQTNARVDRPQAILHARRGVYVCETAELNVGVLTYTGRLRVRDLAGERRYERHRRSYRLAAGEWIEWLDVEAAAA